MRHADLHLRRQTGEIIRVLKNRTVEDQLARIDALADAIAADL